MQEGTVVEWYVGEGERIEEGDVIAEVESEKTIREIEAQEAGVVRRIYLSVGATAKPGTPLGIIAKENEEISGLEERAENQLDEAETSARADSEPALAHRSDNEDNERPGVRATPRAKKRAEEHGIDLGSIRGSGPQEAITAKDVEQAIENTSLTVADERQLRGMRQTISNRLGSSYRNAVHVTVDRAVNAEELLAATRVAAESSNSSISLIDVLLRAVSKALEEHPEFNARFEDSTHRVFEEHNIALAVDIEEGLVTPVISNVQTLSLSELADKRNEIVRRATSGEYTEDELANGTFTVSNLGPYNVDSFTPIINPPQVAILGVNRVEPKAVPAEEGVSFQRRLTVSLSFDHRVIDGADAARFLDTLATNIENAWELSDTLPDDSRSEENRSPELPERTVTAKTEGGFSGVVELGAYRWEYDEPEAIGGAGTAPTPVDHYLGSLGSCLAVTIGSQAEKHDVDISSVEVDVEGRPDRGRLQEIEVTIALDADVDSELLERIVRTSKRACYVTDLLRDDFPLEISWVNR